MSAQPKQEEDRITGVQVCCDARIIAHMAKDRTGDGRVPCFDADWDLRHDNSRNKSTWTLLPLTAHLGLPLQHKCPVNVNGPPSGRLDEHFNETLRQLSLDINPDSKTFGDSFATFRYDFGLSRADFQSFELRDAKALEAFVRLELADVRVLQDLKGRVSEAIFEAAKEKAKVKAAQATPEVFAEFRKQYVKGPVCQN